MYFEINKISNGADFAEALLLSDCQTFLHYFFTRLNVMAPSVQFFTKLTFAEQAFVKNTCTKFHRNPTDGLVADTMSRTDIFST